MAATPRPRRRKASSRKATTSRSPRRRARVSRTAARRRLLFRSLRIALPLAAAAAVAFFFWVDRLTVQRFEARTRTFPSHVYAASLELTPGDRFDDESLRTELDRLGYEQVRGEPARPGQWRRRGTHWDLYLREAETPQGARAATPVTVDAWWGRVRRVRERATGRGLDSVSLEPELLFTFYGDHFEERRWIPLDRIPRLLRQAVIAVEDHRFQRHYGVDPIGIARALAVNLRAGGTRQGGSTITQQLVKNLLGPGKRTLGRKVLEAGGALTMELRYDKDAILEAYLNEAYLGQRGPVAVSGVGEASRFYFDRDVGELDLPRAALLAGMIQSPGRYNPWLHPDAARARRDLVLALLRDQGTIDDGVYRSSIAAGLGVRPSPPAWSRYPWLEDYLGREVREVAPEALPSRAGFSLFTTFDGRVQRAAEEALADGIRRVAERLGRPSDPPEGAVVVLRPRDGALLGLVGGRDHGVSQFNRAVDSRRPPGSTFKPFVFAAGFERAERDASFHFTAATQLEDIPLEIRSGGKLWTPENFDRTFRDRVSARQALEESINVPTVRAAMSIGLPSVVETARRCGIRSRVEPLPSIALGTEEVSPLELAGAYATFANGGLRVEPRALKRAVARGGESVTPKVAAPSRVLDEGVAYLVTDLLQGVMIRGTGRSSARLGFVGHAAGKTGSSDDLRDAWFVGYTPDLLALVWVGYDDNRPLGLPGGAVALPIWVDLMKRLEVDGSRAFEIPRQIVEVDLDPDTFGLATRRCPRVAREIFLEGTEPREPCVEHGGRRRSWWNPFRRDRNRRERP